MAKSCIVSEELSGLNEGGGVGICSKGMADHLLSIGHDFDFIVTDLSMSQKNADPSLVRIYNCIFLSEFMLSDTIVSYCDSFISKSYSVYRLIKDNEYTVVHLNDSMGSGFYVAMARRQGLFSAFVVTHLHGGAEWVREGNLTAPSLDSFECDALERSQIENSDHVVSPTRYILDWYRTRGHAIRSSSLLPWMLPQWMSEPVATSPLKTKGIGADGVKELVFFGRHERRKGFDLFVEAVAGLPASRQVPITFIGRFDRIEAEFTGSRALRRLADYRGAIKFLTDLDQRACLAFIDRSPGVLCVMPSLAENSPCAIVECLTLGIPFLANDVGGVAELIDLSSRDHCLVEPTANSLRKAILRIFSNGQQPIVSTLDIARIKGGWTEEHGRIWKRAARYSPPKVGTPLVSVCVTHFERPDLLRRAIEGLQAQTYDAIEIILVDDGSSSAAAAEMLAEIEVARGRFPINVIRSKNCYLGAARNLAARHANGEFLMFHDDDNVAEPHEVATFVKAALSSNADILTAQAFVFDESEDYRVTRRIPYHWIGIGGLFSFFRSRFGDANALIRRSVFFEVGGFTELRDVGWEDWEFFLKAYLRGYRMGVVADPLFHYRTNSVGMLATGSVLLNQERIYAAVDAYRPRLGGDLLRFIHAKSLNELLASQFQSRVANEIGSEIQVELASLDPNGTEVRAKLSDYAFAVGRREDAMELALPDSAQREKLEALVARSPSAQARTSRIQVVASRNQRDALVLQGWLFNPSGAMPRITHASVDGRRYEVVCIQRTSRADVQRQFDLPTADSLGFTLVALPASAWAGLRKVSNAAYRKIACSATSELTKVQLLTQPRVDWRGHVDNGLWLQRVALAHAVHYWTIETREPSVTAVDYGNGDLDFGEVLSPQRRRFVPRPTQDADGSTASGATALVPNAHRSDVVTW